MQRLKNSLKLWALGFCTGVTIAVVILLVAVFVKGQETLNVNSLLGVVVICALVSAAAVIAYAENGVFKRLPYVMRTAFFAVCAFAIVIAVGFIFKWFPAEGMPEHLLRIGVSIFITEAILVIAQWRFRRAGKGYDIALGLYKKQKKGNGH